jgi:cytochrome P450
MDSQTVVTNHMKSALVIKEALRLHPAVALMLERIVPEGGCTVAGQYIPAGTIVGMNAWVLHNDADVFGPDVGEFRPERWKESDRADDQERQKMMERSFFAVSCYG